MKHILVKTGVVVLFFMVSFLKGEAQSIFGESWYQGGLFYYANTSMSPDGNILLAPEEKTIEFLSTLDGIVIKEVDKVSNNLNWLMWSPDGKYFVSMTDSLRLIDTLTYETLKTIGPKTNYIDELSFSPDRKYLLAGDSIYETENWTRVEHLLVKGDFSLFLPGDSIRVSVLEGNIDTVIISRFPSGDKVFVYSLKINDRIAGIAAHHKTNSVTIATESIILVMKIDNGRILSVTPKEEYSGQGRFPVVVAISPNDDMLLIDSKIFDTKSGNTISDLNAIKILHISPDWKRFFVWRGAGGGRICTTNDMPRLGYSSKMVDDSGKLLWKLPFGHDAHIKTITFDTLSNTISSISEDSVQIHWDTIGNIKQLEYAKDFTPDTSNMSSSGKYQIIPGTIKLNIRDNSTDSIICVLNESHPAPEAPKILFKSWAWAPNEKYIFTCSKPMSYTDNIFLKIWDIHSGKGIDSIQLPCYATMIKVSPDGKAVALATEEYGVMYLKITGDISTITSVVKDTPEEFSLSFHPNPLKESSTISYSLPNDDVVKITLYDVLGNEIAIIHDGFKSARAYTLPFKNAALPNGTYFLKMSAGGRTLTKSVSILK